MKSAPVLIAEIFRTFLLNHPEVQLGGSGISPLTLHMADKEKIYARMGIEHAVQFIIEEIAVEQGQKRVAKSSKKND